MYYEAVYTDRFRKTKTRTRRVSTADVLGHQEVVGIKRNNFVRTQLLD